jgi:hypothetical protein
MGLAIAAMHYVLEQAVSGVVIRYGEIENPCNGSKISVFLFQRTPPKAVELGRE